MRRLPETLLLALFLLAVQTAILTHAHAENAPPAGAAAQGCEYCVGHSAAAPAPEACAAARPRARASAVQAPPAAAPASSRFPSDCRSRAPPTPRST